MAYRMKVLPFAVLMATVIAVPAFAQQGNAPVPEIQGSPQSVIPSDRTITMAGHALRDVLTINRSYSARLARTTDPAAKDRVVTDARRDATTAIQRDGLTVGQYDQVLASARQNPTVRERLMRAAGIPNGTH